MPNNNKKGFTLIELLVVMGILGILMAVTILVINPAEYLARARDTQRISDLQTLNSAIATYLSNNNLLAATTTINATVALATTPSPTLTTTTAVNAGRTGASSWVKMDLTSAGLSTLPLDPKNSGNFAYLYYSDGTNYEIASTAFESTYYTATNNVASNDGGLRPATAGTACAIGAPATCMYEVGSSLTLIK